MIYYPTVELLDHFKCEYLVHGDDLAIGADGVDCKLFLLDYEWIFCWESAIGCPISFFCEFVILSMLSPITY